MVCIAFPLIVVVVVTSVAMYSRMFIVPTVTQMQKLSTQWKWQHALFRW